MTSKTMAQAAPEYLGQMSHAAAAAWQESFLGRLPQRAASLLAASAIEIEADEGQEVRRSVLTAPSMPMLVAEGLVRVFVSSPQEREVTVRYVREGAVIGLSAALAGGARHGVQAVTPARLVVLQSGTLRHLAQREPGVAWVLCQELRDTVLEITDHLATNVFQSVIERVAGTLFELAEETEGGDLVVRANQKQVADAVGSVREVVARALRQLAAAGLIERVGTETRITDPAALERLASFGVDSDSV